MDLLGVRCSWPYSACHIHIISLNLTPSVWGLNHYFLSYNQGNRLKTLNKLVKFWCWQTSHQIRPDYKSYIFSLNFCCCSVSWSLPTLCDPMGCSMPAFPVLHYLPELAQTHVHWVGDAVQSRPLSSPSPPAFNLSQHQGLFQWVSSSHQVAKVFP